MDGYNVEQINSFQYLGALFSEQLFWQRNKVTLRLISSKLT